MAEAGQGMSRELKPHGTVAAYRRHQRAGEKPCAACRQAYNAWRPSRAVPPGQWRAQPGGKPGRRWGPDFLKPCGTVAAYARHLRRGERPCRSCAQARARYDQDRAAA